MLCDELKVYVKPLKTNMLGKTIVGQSYYIKSDVDAAIAELKQKLEDVQASMYADVVDANMENRRLKRALWLERAERAKSIKWHEGLERYLQERKKKWWPSRFTFMSDEKMYHVWHKCWCDVERKYRAKAEEYL